jgi:ADP-heptose:LPS heptosyltransferase
VKIDDETRRRANELSTVLTAELATTPPAAPAAGGPLRVVVNISTPSVSRRWPPEKIIELARGMDTRRATMLIASTPEDAELARQIASQAGAGLLPPCRDFALFVALLDLADIIVTPDTSIVHIAAALGKPVLVLNTAADAAAAWTPWGVPYRLLCGRGEVSEIAVADVGLELASLLDEIAASHKPSTRL